MLQPLKFTACSHGSIGTTTEHTWKISRLLGRLHANPRFGQLLWPPFCLMLSTEEEKNHHTLCTISFQGRTAHHAASGSNTCSNRSFWKQSGLIRACQVYAYVPQTHGNVREVTPSRYSPRYPMPRVHLHDVWTNTCGLVDVARAFGLVGYACATKCEKCEKEGKAYALHWKSSRMRACFWTAQNAKIWSFIETTTRFICFARRCCSLSYSSFSTRTSRRLGCIYTLSSPPFSCQAPTSFFLAPITTFAILTSWQWDC